MMAVVLPCLNLMLNDYDLLRLPARVPEHIGAILFYNYYDKPAVMFSCVAELKWYITFAMLY